MRLTKNKKSRPPKKGGFFLNTTSPIFALKDGRFRMNFKY
jgi:hypothetical protein